MRLDRAFFVGFLVVLVSTVTSATTWNVAPTGCNDTSCTPCCTIHAAVQKSSGGDVISVAPGAYPEIVDFRLMASVGDITLEAAAGPGTVSISSSADEPLRHGGSFTNTVTLDGLDITAGGGYSCIYFNHMGNVVLRDVTANNCGYTAIMLDNPGTVVMERCTADSSGRTGIQIDGAASAYLTDCTANSNVSNGIDVYSLGTIDIVNPTTIGNWDGVTVFAVAPTTITGSTTTDNGRDGIVVETTSSLIITNPSANGNAAVGINLLTHDSTTITNGTASNNIGQGIWAWSTASVSIDGTTVAGNGEGGIDIEWDGVDPVDQVTLTNVDVVGNGVGTGERGVRLRNIEGPVVVTNCTFDNNGDDGFSVYETMIGDLEIYGGHANGNGDDGYDLSATGNVTVIGAAANNNNNYGFELDMPGTVFFQDCVANGNFDGGGFKLEWRDPDPIDAISVIDCTANNNGVFGGGEGVDIRSVAGPVTVVGTEATGNADAGIAIRDVNNTVLIRGVTSVSNGEDGIKLDVGGGPISVFDSLVDGSTGAGIAIAYGGVDIQNLQIRRNTITGNGTNGVEFYDVGGPGPFVAKCNDIVGNSTGLYLADSVTVDARYVWWGDPTGPSGQGSGAGDAIWAEPGGTILFNPWLSETFTAPVSGCPLFESDFESGLLAEWDLSSP